MSQDKMINKQVDSSHYNFKSYMNKARWASVWHQVSEVIDLSPKKVLEVGPGAGVFKAITEIFGINTETLDLDPDLKPDHVGSATAIPLPDSYCDVVCAFQMLEHLPYLESIKSFEEMERVTSRFIVISLPDAKSVWRYSGDIPKFGNFDKLINRPFTIAKQHKFDGEHHWEINKKGYELEKIIKDFSELASLLKTYRVKENPYHRFFLFESNKNKK